MLRWIRLGSQSGRSLGRGASVLRVTQWGYGGCHHWRAGSKKVYNIGKIQDIVLCTMYYVLCTMYMDNCPLYLKPGWHNSFMKIWASKHMFFRYWEYLQIPLSGNALMPHILTAGTLCHTNEYLLENRDENEASWNLVMLSCVILILALQLIVVVMNKTKNMIDLY